MSVMSDLHVSACTTIYDILRNRLSLPEEESTYELAVDIFDAISEDLKPSDYNREDILEAYKEKLDLYIDVTVKQLDKGSVNTNSYGWGYLNGLNHAEGLLSEYKDTICEGG